MKLGDMSSSTSFLVEAWIAWIRDNGLTPEIVVYAGYPGVSVPQGFVKNGYIVLDVSESAIEGVVSGRDELTFSKRFRGHLCSVVIPYEAVQAIRIVENEFVIDIFSDKLLKVLGIGRSAERDVSVGADDEQVKKPELTLVH